MADADERLPPDRTAERLAAIYAAAERQLRSMIRGAQARGAVGTAGYFSRQHARVVAVQARLRAANRALVPQLARDAYEPAVHAARAAFDVPESFAGVHEDAVTAIAQALGHRLDGAVRTVGREADDVFRRIGLEETGGGFARGDTGRAVAARIRSRLADEGVTAFVDRRGRRWRLETYAAMVARTTAREAATLGTVNSMLEMGEDLVKVSDHDTQTPLCERFEGKTYSLTGKSGRYPRISAYPPFHPNCQHVLLPAPVAFEEWERELGLAVA